MTAIADLDQVSRLPVSRDVDGYLGACAAAGSDEPPELIEDQISVEVVDRPDRLAELAAQQRDRLGASNVSVDQELARAGGCGFIHLDTGRVCQLARSHPESRKFGLRDARVSASS